MPDSTAPLARICVRVFQDDYDFIREMADAAPGEVSANLILRTIIHNYVNQIRANQRGKIDSTQTIRPSDVDLSSIEIDLGGEPRSTETETEEAA